jgi:hypothetical protein
MSNRYDRLNELDSDAPLFQEEAWVQAPDGSWVRPGDKAAKKGRKGKGKIEAAVPPPQRAPEPPPPPPAAEPKRRLNRQAEATVAPPEPPRRSSRRSEPVAPPPIPVSPAVLPIPAVPPVAPDVAEPKRWFGRASKAERQREAELERQRIADRERIAELERMADLRQQERERQAELERQAEAERLAEMERQTELRWKAELQRQTELEQQAEQERARATALEREIELERARVAELERKFERERPAEPDGGYWRDPSDQTFQRWPDGTGEHPAGFEPKHASSGKSKAKGKAKTKPEPKAAPPPRPVSTRGPRSVGERVVNIAVAVGLVAATVLLGAGIRWIGPDPAGAQRPFTSAGRQGESLDARQFTVTVQAARAVATVQSGKSALTTQGAWVIARVRVTAKTQPTGIGYVALRDSEGHTYLASDRLAQPLLDGKRTFQPGIPMEGEVVFEVPKTALPGLTALFAAHPEALELDAMAAARLPALTLGADQAPAALAVTEVRP